MPEELAYDITRMLIENRGELARDSSRSAESLAGDGRQGIARRIPSRRTPLLSPGRRVEVISRGWSARSRSRFRSPKAPRRAPSTGWIGAAVTTLAIGLSLYALYWVLFIVQPQIYRVSFLLVALVLTFLLFPARRGAGGPPSPVDWVLAAVVIVALAWPLVDFSRFIYRAADPPPIDVVLGVVADRARARGDAARRRVDPAGDGAGVSRLRVLRSGVRSHRPAASRAPRLSDRSACRHALHDARGRVRRAARRRGDLHRAVHDLRRGPRVLRRRRVLHQLGAGGDGEVAIRRRAGAHGDARRVSARHGVGQRCRDHGDAGLGRRGRCCGAPATNPKWAARFCRPPASARSCHRRRWVPRRS